MLWENGRYDWPNMTNKERAEALENVVFPAYLEEFVRHSYKRKDLLKEYGVRCDLFGCSDPRVHTDFFGGIPGEIFIKRGVGGKFDLGFPTFRAKFSRVLDKSESKDYNHVIFISYHYSKLSAARGCAGHQHDDAAAKNYSRQLFNEMKGLFSGKDFVVPILCGIETDNGGITMHGHNGKLIECQDFYYVDEGEIYRELFYMFPGANDNVLFFLTRCIKGNGRYVNEIHPVDLPVLQDHNEFCIGYGEGFFSFPRGRIMVVNPFSYPFSDDSHLFGALAIQAKLQERGIIKNGFLMVSGSIYDREDEKKWAIAESLAYQRTAREVMAKRFSHLIALAEPFSIIMNRDSREVTVIK